jgi:hypothetical protein
MATILTFHTSDHRGVGRIVDATLIPREGDGVLLSSGPYKITGVIRHIPAGYIREIRANVEPIAP